MSGAFQGRIFQALAYQVGRFFARKLDCVARIVDRGTFACAARGPTMTIAARGPELAHPLHLSAAATPRLEASLERRGPCLRASAVERSTP